MSANSSPASSASAALPMRSAGACSSLLMAYPNRVMGAHVAEPIPWRAMLYDYTTTTAESVTNETDTAIATADGLVAEAVAAPPSFDATLRPLELAGAELVRAYGRGAFMGQVHTDPAVRDAGNEAEERLNKWRVALAFRTDLYEAVKAFSQTDAARGLARARARRPAPSLRACPRAGHHLPADQRAELEKLRTRVGQLRRREGMSGAGDEQPRHLRDVQDLHRVAQHAVV